MVVRTAEQPILVGAEAWRRTTSNDIKSSRKAIERSDGHIHSLFDPTFLPHLKDMVIEKADYTALDYMRGTRNVVTRLRQVRNTINDKLKTINKMKKAIESEIENAEIAIKLNAQSHRVRATRPTHERIPDVASSLLDGELFEFSNIKASLQDVYNRIKDYSLRLGICRDRLDAVLRERQRVTELIPNTAGGLARNQAHSAPKGLGARSRTEVDLIMPPRTPDIPDPLGPYTTHCDQAINDAVDLLEQCKDLEADCRRTVQRARQRLAISKERTNSSIDQKMAETVQLQQQLYGALGENRNATYRAQRYYDKLEHAYLDTLGPERYSNITTGDRLDRPIIRVYQRHPGNISADAVELIKARTGLQQNMQKCSYQIGELKMGHLRMTDNLRDKRAALQIDGDVVRMRRRERTMPSIRI